MIFGKSSAEDNIKTSQYRVAGAGSTTITVTDCHRTGDHYTTDVATDFPSGVTNYPGASTVLWTDPANGNFTFKDDGFIGKSTAGDPRWW